VGTFNFDVVGTSDSTASNDRIMCWTEKDLEGFGRGLLSSMTYYPGKSNGDFPPMLNYHIMKTYEEVEA
jgi:hypothetical protein